MSDLRHNEWRRGKEKISAARRCRRRSADCDCDRVRDRGSPRPGDDGRHGRLAIRTTLSRSPITSIKDANLATPNDFIAAYAQVEPLEKEYDQKLDKYNKLYNAMRERDAHRSLFDLQRFRGTRVVGQGEASDATTQ
jgi:hypothetical protein